MWGEKVGSRGNFEKGGEGMKSSVQSWKLFEQRNSVVLRVQLSLVVIYL
jgi:hypothetical protein